MNRYGNYEMFKTTAKFKLSIFENSLDPHLITKDHLEFKSIR